MQLVLATVGTNQLNVVLSGYRFLITIVGSRQQLLQPVARKVSSRRGRVGEGRGVVATAHGHKLAMVRLHTFDCINFETSNCRLKSDTFFGTPCTEYRVETTRSDMLNLNNFR